MRRLGLLLALILAPSLAWAHAPFPGIRGFYVGFLHPLTSLSHILLIISICLLLGSLAGQKPRKFLVATAAGASAGILVAMVTGTILSNNPISIVLAGVLGIVVVLAWRPKEVILVGLIALSAFALALESLPDPGRFGDVLITCLGSVAGIFYLIMYGARGVHEGLQRWQAAWVPISLRVAGSWITAVSCLMLAFQIAMPL